MGGGKKSVGCILEALRCRKLILGRDTIDKGV